MKNYKHSNQWYIRTHNIIASIITASIIPVIILICGFLENI